MSFLSPTDVLDMLNHQEQLKERIEQTKELGTSAKCLSALMSLSEELRSYSHQNRALAEQLRQKSAARRAEVGRSFSS